MRIAASVALVLLVLAVYGRTYTFPFVNVDDGRYVFENAHVLDGLNESDARWAFTTLCDGNWFPLTWLSLMADGSLHARFAGGYHLTNVVLHMLNAVLLLAFLEQATGCRGRSFFTAALFAVHPIHVESVAWVSERKDVLSIFFGLLALCAYVRFARRRRHAWLAACWCLFVCSLLSKQILVTLPFVLLLLDYWPLQRWPPSAWRRLVLEKLPFLAVSVVFCGIAYYAQSHGGATTVLAPQPLWSRFGNPIVAYGLYLRKLFAPFDLAFFYPWPRNGLAVSSLAISGTVLLIVTAAAIAQIKRRPYLFVGWCWFLGTLVPMIGLVQIGRQQLADRYAYFPAIGVYIAVVWLAPAASARLRWTTALAGALAIVGCVAAAFVQVAYWSHSDKLFHHALAVTEDNETTRGLWGISLILDRRFDAGLWQLRRAVELAPNDTLARNRLARGLADARRPTEALEQYEASLRINEAQADAHYEMAIVLSRSGNQAAAREHARRAIELKPELAEIARRQQQDGN